LQIRAGSGNVWIERLEFPAQSEYNSIR